MPSRATAWEHRARAAEAALRELAHHPEDAALVDDMAALLRSLRHPLTASDGRPPEQDVARIDALLERYDAATRDRYGGS